MADKIVADKIVADEIVADKMSRTKWYTDNNIQPKWLDEKKIEVHI